MMFQAKVRTLQKSPLNPAYYLEEFKEYEITPPFEPELTHCYFVGSVEDFDLFKGWLLAHDNVNMDEVEQLVSLDSPELSHSLWKHRRVTYFTKVDPCSQDISTKIP